MKDLEDLTDVIKATDDFITLYDVVEKFDIDLKSAKKRCSRFLF